MLSHNTPETTIFITAFFKKMQKLWQEIGRQWKKKKKKKS